MEPFFAVVDGSSDGPLAPVDDPIRTVIGSSSKHGYNRKYYYLGSSGIDWEPFGLLNGCCCSMNVMKKNHSSLALGDVREGTATAQSLTTSLGLEMFTYPLYLGTVCLCMVEFTLAQ